MNYKFYSVRVLKLRHSEKATKFEKIFHLFWCYCVNDVNDLKNLNSWPSASNFQEFFFFFPINRKIFPAVVQNNFWNIKSLEKKPVEKWINKKWLNLLIHISYFFFNQTLILVAKNVVLNQNYRMFHYYCPETAEVHDLFEFLKYVALGIYNFGYDNESTKMPFFMRIVFRGFSLFCSDC